MVKTVIEYHEELESGSLELWGDFVDGAGEKVGTFCVNRRDGQYQSWGVYYFGEEEADTTLITDAVQAYLAEHPDIR